ncbi:unnamed protein product, partial [Gadus morhua 'NCC']
MNLFFNVQTCSQTSLRAHRPPCESTAAPDVEIHWILPGLLVSHAANTSRALVFSQGSLGVPQGLPSDCGVDTAWTRSPWSTRLKAPKARHKAPERRTIDDPDLQTPDDPDLQTQQSTTSGPQSRLTRWQTDTNRASSRGAVTHGNETCHRRRRRDSHDTRRNTPA